MNDEDATVEAPVARFPEILGPCRLIRKVGSGGMGTVFLAEMMEERNYAQRGSRVAVKVLHPGLTREPSTFQRFQREARLGATLTDPAVVRIFGAESASVGTDVYHFIIMEHVEGKTLRTLMDRHQVLPEALLRHIALRIARGLKAVHSAGIIHRDVKPANILITPAHEVKLMDLGVARLVNEAIRLTDTGDFIGTLQYAAPEQFEMEEAGTATDLYALGVILYEAATGINPFAVGSRHAVMWRQMEYVPSRAGELNTKISPFIEDIIACLLEKDPSRRFADAAALADVLDAGECSSWWRERSFHERIEPRSRGILVSHETPMVDRESELSQLLHLFQEAREGRGKFVYLEGEAGVGKTRLLYEFFQEIEALDTDIRLLYGSYQPKPASASLGAMAQAISNYFGGVGLEARLAPFLEATPHLVPVYTSMLTGIPLPEGTEPLSMEAFQSVTCFLARSLAADRPLIWIADDIHFGTQDDWTLLLSLARMLHDKRILFIASSRPGLPPAELAHFKRLECFRGIMVRRLETEGVRKLLNEILHSGTLAERLVDPIAAKSDGNPYFLLEIIKGLREQELLNEDTGGKIVLTADFTNVMVPSSIHSLLEERLSDLDIAHRELLEAGAVQGHNFDPDLLARMMNRNRLEVLQSLAGMERQSGLVHGTGTAFQFDHHLLQEFIYRSVPPLLRKEYHARLARAFLEREGISALSCEESSGERALFLAENFLKGGEEERGLEFALSGMNHLMSHYRNGELLELAGLVLPVLGDGEPALRCRIRLKQAKSLGLQGARDAQREAIDDALKAARSSEDPALMASALLERGDFLVSTSEISEGRDILEEALRLARECQNNGVELASMKRLGYVSQLTGDQQKARDYYERLAKRAREVGDRKFEGRAYGSLGWLFRLQNKLDSAREYLTRHVEIGRDTGDLLDEATAEAALGGISHVQGEYDEALRHYERQLSLHREAGNRSGEGTALHNIGNTLQGAGRFEEAQWYLESCMSLFRELGDRSSESVAGHNLGRLLRQRGKPQEAHDTLLRSLQLCREVRYHAHEPQLLFALGETCFLLGRFNEAMEHLESSRVLHAELGNRRGEAQVRCFEGAVHFKMARFELARKSLESALSVFKDVQDHISMAMVLSYLGELAVGTGQLDEAEIHLKKCEKICHERGIEVIRGPMMLLFGDLERARGRNAKARRYYSEALIAERALSNPVGIAITTLGLGRSLLEEGESDEALPLLEKAHDNLDSGCRGILGSLPSAYLVLLGKLEPTAVGLSEEAPVAAKAEAHLVLYRAGAGSNHLKLAEALLHSMASDLSPEDRQVFWRHNVLARSLKEETERL